MKTILITLGVLLGFNSFAQISFLEASQHTIRPNSIGVANGIQWNDTTYIALYDAYFGLGSHRMHIIEYNEFGKRKKEFTPTYHYGGAIPNKITRIGKDKIYLTGSGDDTLGRFTSFNYMYDKDWNVLWSKGYASRYRDIELIDDSVGITPVFIRNYLQGIGAINLNTGDTIWTKSYQAILGINDSVKLDVVFSNLTINKDYIFSLFQENNTDLNVISVSKFDGTYVRSDTIRSPVFDQSVLGFNKGYWFLSIYNNAHNIDLLKVEGPSILIADTIRKVHSLAKNRIQLDSKGLFHFSLKHFVGSNSPKNFCEIRVYNEKGALEKSTKYSVVDSDLGFNVSVCSKNGYFITGYSNYLSPENRSFIMKTDSNGFVSNPTLFPLVVDTNLSDTSSSIDEINSFEDLSLFPNPASSTLTISAPNNQNLSYVLIDLNGRKVLFGEFSNKILLDVSELNKGMYFLRIENIKNAEFITRKVVIEE